MHKGPSTWGVNKRAGCSTDPYPIFYVSKRNIYGDPQLVENYDDVVMDSRSIMRSINLKSNDFWSIKNPSQEVYDFLNIYHMEWTTFRSGCDIFALSPKASKVLKPCRYRKNSSILIEFSTPTGKLHYLLTVDNKAYTGFMQGNLNPHESYTGAAKRNAMEKLGIDLTNIHIVPVAEYNFRCMNKLVDFVWDCNTKVFFAHLSWDNVKHLFQDNLNDDEINIVDISNLDNCRKQEEITHIITIPVDSISDAPEYFDTIKRVEYIKDIKYIVSLKFLKKSHHRQILELFKTYDEIELSDFIDSINFHTRYENAMRRIRI